MDWYVSATVLFIGLLVLLAFGIPVSFSIGLLGTAGLLALGGSQLSMTSIIAFGTSNSFILVSLPMFVLMAEIIAQTGLSGSLFDAARKWLSGLPGGLGIATIFGCGIFAALCGSSVATAATMGLVALPEMLKHRYDKRLAVGCLAGGGALGILIPPSIPFIIYGDLTGESIGKLFMSGIIPGGFSVLLFSAYLFVIALKNPKMAPRTDAVPMKERLLAVTKTGPALLLILVVLGGIYFGVATPSEAAAIGCLGAVVLGLVVRRLSLSGFKSALLHTARTTSFILMILVSAHIFGYLLTILEIPQQLSQLALSLSVSRWVFLIGVLLLWIFLGCFLDPIAIMVLTIPVLFPIIKLLQFDPIWFGTLCVINMEIAQITPPVGFNLFVLRGIAPDDISMGDIIVGSLPFVGLHAVTLGLVMAFPAIALWLPNLMK